VTLTPPRTYLPVPVCGLLVPLAGAFGQLDPDLLVIEFDLVHLEPPDFFPLPP
jgi:hypothetical protein